MTSKKKPRRTGTKVSLKESPTSKVENNKVEDDESRTSQNDVEGKASSSPKSRRRPIPTEKLLAFVFGAIFIGICAYAGLREKPFEPTNFFFMRLVSAIAAAGVAAVVPGFLLVRIGSRKRWGIQAGGAIAVFVLVWFFNPPAFVGARTLNEIKGMIDDSTKETGQHIDDAAMRGRVATWRASHGFGSVTGSSSVTLDMPEKEELPELAAWLARVKSKYEQMKRRTNLDGGGVVVDREVEGSDTYGLDFIEMNGSKNPKDNWDLVPDRANEEFVDRVFFQPRYALMASSAPGGHLLAPTMFLNLKCSRLRVFFNPTTQRPVRIDGYAEGGGKANPTGQFANWLDLYGSRLIVRLLGVGDYEMRDGGGQRDHVSDSLEDRELHE